MPVVTISRMYGSGGSEVAARVAERLGWTLYDNAVVDAVAERLGCSPEEVSAREERVPTLAERIADALVLGSPEAMLPVSSAQLAPSEDRVLEVTTRVLGEAVARGPAVIVGRGAQCMLASRADALHVFCYAPREALVRRAMSRLGVDREEAEHTVDETNRQREQYVRKYWNRSWRALENYDVCVNTERLGIERAAELVATLAKERL